MRMVSSVFTVRIFGKLHSCFKGAWIPEADRPPGPGLIDWLYCREHEEHTLGLQPSEDFVIFCVNKILVLG